METPSTPRVGGAAARTAALVAAAAAVLIAGTVVVLLATRDAREAIDTNADSAQGVTPAQRAYGTPALEALGRRSPWNGYAATSDWLVVYFGGDMDHLDQEPEYAAAPLVGGQDVTIDLTLDGENFSPSHLVADDEHALVVGRRSAAPLDDATTHAERFCDGGTPAAFRIDPSSGDVAQVAIDQDVQAVDGLYVTSSQRTTDGWWLVARADQRGDLPAETVLLRATSDHVGLAARWVGDGDACVAGAFAYQMLRPEGPVVQRVPIGGEPGDTIEAVELPTPDTARPGSFGQLVCSPDGPLLAGMVLTGEPAVVVWHGDKWHERDDLVPPKATTPAGDGISDHGGAVLTWSDEERHGVITVLPAGGEPRFEQADGGHLWHGSSGTRLGLIHREDDPGVVTTTLPPGRFPGFDQLLPWE